MISIIIPTYNRGYIIEKSIESILEQTYKEFELIIVDDCSTDKTEEIIKKIKDERIRYIKLEKNSGANKARNKGIENAKYDIIAFQDSDDCWHRDKLEKQLKYMVKGKFEIVGCSYNQYLNESFNRVVPKKRIDDRISLYKELLQGNFLSTQTLLGRKEHFFNEKFDENLPRLQDWDLVIRLSKKYKIGFMNTPLVDVFVQKDSITNNPEKGLTALKIIHEKYEEDFIKYKESYKLCNKIYLLSILLEREEKKYAKLAFIEEKNIRTIFFYLISTLNLKTPFKLCCNVLKQIK